MGTQTDTTVRDTSANGSGGIHGGESELELRQPRNDIIVGIPTYNEEIAIGSVVLQAKRYADEVSARYSTTAGET